MNSKSRLTLLVIAAVLAVGYLPYEILLPKPASLTPIQAGPRSQAPGIITRLVMAKGIDIKTGEAVGETVSFSQTESVIYAVMTLKRPPKGTRFAYVRYLNGKFLDNRSMEVTKTSTNDVSFNWKLKKPGDTHPVGNYRLKVYTDGVFEKDINYTVY